MFECLHLIASNLQDAAGLFGGPGPSIDSALPGLPAPLRVTSGGWFSDPFDEEKDRQRATGIIMPPESTLPAA